MGKWVCQVLLLRNKLQLHKDMSSISFDDLVGRIANVMFDNNPEGGDVAKGSNNIMGAHRHLLATLKWSLSFFLGCRVLERAEE